jgi:type VI secretion system protein ImpH
MLGPNGPLPLHLTEYVWQRVKHHGDHTFARFLDLFHHRMLSFLYRAWVDANPAISHDRPETDRSPSQLGAFLGVGTSALREKDALGDSARRYYAGQFADPVAHPEGLRALIEDHFGVPATIEEFVGEWAEIPPHCLWRMPDPALGPAAESGRLGLSTTLGSRVWLVQNRFRIVLGPLSRLQFNRVSPGGPDVAALTSMVRGYAGDGMRWDFRLRLLPEAVPTLQLGQAIIGQTSWLWSTGEKPQDDLIFEPLAPAC